LGAPHGQHRRGAFCVLRRLPRPGRSRLRDHRAERLRGARAAHGGRARAEVTALPRPLAECLVVVTPRSFGMHDPGLRRRLEAEVGAVHYRPGPLAAADLVGEVRDADGLLAGLDYVGAEVFAGAPRLRVVSRYGVGVDRVDLTAAARHGVTVTVTPGANANAVAEMTIGLLFALARPLVMGHERARHGEWPALSGLELAGRVLGLVGLGRIGPA